MEPSEATIPVVLFVLLALIDSGVPVQNWFVEIRDTVRRKEFMI